MEDKVLEGIIKELKKLQEAKDDNGYKAVVKDIDDMKQEIKDLKKQIQEIRNWR